MLAHSEIGRRDSNEADTRALLISDVSPADPLRINLERSPLDLQFCRPGAAAVAAAIQERPQLLLVDCRTDDGTGLQLCSTLRSLDELSSAFLIVITGETVSVASSCRSRARIEARSAWLSAAVPECRARSGSTGRPRSCTS